MSGKKEFEQKLNKYFRVRKIYDVMGVVMVIAFVLSLLVLLSFVPVLPSGYVEGRTPIWQYFMVLSNSRIYFTIALTMGIISFILYISRKVIFRKFLSFYELDKKNSKQFKE